jgi:hypothetical protein
MRRSRLLIGLCGLFIFCGWIANVVADDFESVKLVTTGRVEKVDAKHKTFQFKFNLDQPQFGRGAARPYPYPGGRTGGRRGRLGGYPGGYPRSPNSVPDNTMEVKVFVSEATRLKARTNSLEFSDLKPGDRVTITAVHRGHGDDLDAQVVTRPN